MFALVFLIHIEMVLYSSEIKFYLCKKIVEKISHKNVRCCQFCCQMYTDVLFQFEFVEIENKKINK